MSGPVAERLRPARPVAVVMADPAMPGRAARALSDEIAALLARARVRPKCGGDLLALRAVRAALAPRLGPDPVDPADGAALADVAAKRARKALGEKASLVLRRRDGAGLEPWIWLQKAAVEVEASGWPGARVRGGRAGKRRAG